VDRLSRGIKPSSCGCHRRWARRTSSRSPSFGFEAYSIKLYQAGQTVATNVRDWALQHRGGCSIDCSRAGVAGASSRRSADRSRTLRCLSRAAWHRPYGSGAPSIDWPAHSCRRASPLWRHRADRPCAVGWEWLDPWAIIEAARVLSTKTTDSTRAKLAPFALRKSRDKSHLGATAAKLISASLGRLA
jgi:hypothetical protein